MSLPVFKLLRPRTMTDALAHLADHAGDIQIVAGGTDLVPSMKQRLFTPKYLLDMRRVDDVPGRGIELGALVTLTCIEESALLRERYPVLVEAVKTVASPILRNMGTIGGNVCLDTRCVWYNQSLTWRKSCGFCIKKDGDLCHVAPGGKKCWAAFSADSPAALLCLDAQLEIAGPSGTRHLPLRDLYTGAGDARMKLGNSEILTKILLPESMAGYSGVYRKLRIRGSIDYPLAGVATAIRRNPDGSIADARVAITGVNPAPLPVNNAAQLLIGKNADEQLALAIGDLAARTAKPLTTSGLTPEYRRDMIRVYTKRAVMAAASA
jgi:4-hydroxybenzoyl-CoA reductase subunit beta